MTRHRGAAPYGTAVPIVAAFVPVVVLGVFFAWPVATIIARGFDPGAVGDVLANAGVREVIWFTVWQAVVSTLLTLVVGLPPAYVLARFRFPGRRLVSALVTVPFVLPTVVVAAALGTALPAQPRPRRARRSSSPTSCSTSPSSCARSAPPGSTSIPT